MRAGQGSSVTAARNRDWMLAKNTNLNEQLAQACIRRYKAQVHVHVVQLSIHIQSWSMATGPCNKYTEAPREKQSLNESESRSARRVIYARASKRRRMIRTTDPWVVSRDALEI